MILITEELASSELKIWNNVRRMDTFLLNFPSITQEEFSIYLVLDNSDCLCEHTYYTVLDNSISLMQTTIEEFLDSEDGIDYTNFRDVNTEVQSIAVRKVY